MSWLSVGLIAGGTAASAAGGIMSRNDALNNAKNSANAQNVVLGKVLQQIAPLSDDNQSTFKNTVASYAPDAASSGLTTAQNNRTNTIESAMTPDDGSGIPLDPNDATTKGELAQKMKDAFNFATAHAQALGNVGSYKDWWFNQGVNNQDAANNINLNDKLANGWKGVLNGMQQAASAASYQAPSVWGPILQGAGSIAGAAGGAGLGSSLGSLGASATGPDMYEIGSGLPTQYVPQVNGGIGHA